MEEKKFPLIFLISMSFLLLSCSTLVERRDEHIFQYQVYDLEYEQVIYVGVCLTLEKEKNNPQYIVYENAEIKELYEKYGIESLINEFTAWYYSQTVSSEWIVLSTQTTIPWNVNTKKYIIYLALRNNYVVFLDDESGYISFEKQL